MTGVAIVFAVVLALAPLSKIVSIILSAVLVFLLGLYFAYVKAEPPLHRE